MKSNVEVKSIVEKQYLGEQLILTQYISSTIEGMLDEKVLLLEVISKKESGVPDDYFVSDFKTIYEVAEVYHALEFIDVNGTVVSGYPEARVPYGYNLYETNRSWAIDHVRDTGDIYISEPTMMLEEILGFFVFVPVFEDGIYQGSIVGIVADRYIVDQFDVSGNDTKLAYIIDSDGLVLYDQSGSYDKGRSYFEYINESETSRLEIVDEQMNGLEGNGKYPNSYSENDGENVLISYSPIKWYNHQWSIAFTSSEAEIDRIIVSVYVKLFTVAALSVLFILFVSFQVYFMLLHWNRSLEKEVEKKTHELQASNESLVAANLKLKELDRLKTEFVSMVSHELKTPLTAMKTSSEFLREDTCDSVVRAKMLDIIIRSVDRQTRMVDDLLDISRIESNKMKYSMADISLSEVVNLSIENISAISGLKGIAMSVDIPDDLPDVHGDKDRLIQVFVNLLGNAIKFTQEGGKVSILAKEIDGYIEARVKDNGVGMDEGQLEMIFDKFYQIDSTMTRKAGGNGLGLAITKGIIEGHGGNIGVESVPGKGSEFIVTLKKLSN
ncbi:sensor histidine kinase [Methanolobus sp. ZRKC3]|uniref:sensor histidine kinase n=1 Tax=Methanolobus sp. ZRKC3 TaxID=3125786 RepID=UPI00324A1FBD